MLTPTEGVQAAFPWKKTGETRKARLARKLHLLPVSAKAAEDKEVAMIDRRTAVNNLRGSMQDGSLLMLFALVLVIWAEFFW